MDGIPETCDVGPAEDPKSPIRKSPRKAPVEQAPKIEMKLDFGKPAKNAGDDVLVVRD